MERQRHGDEELIEREIQDETDSPELDEESEIEGAEAIYGETDMDPNREDQRSAHHAEEDEHFGSQKRTPNPKPT